MDIKQLESFFLIAKTKSFTKAADRLFLTQPTVSNHINTLENELGTVLFNRLNKTVTLTRAGEILYEYAKDIIHKRESALYALSEYRGRIEGVLEIASSSIPEQYFLIDFIAEFHKKFPLVKYLLYKYDTGEVIDKLISDEIDFGIVGFKKKALGIEYIEILDDELVLIASERMAEDIGRSLNKDNIYDVPFIVRERESGSRKTMANSLSGIGIKVEDLNIIAEIADNEALKKFVAKDMGVSFISRRAIKRELLSKELVVIDFDEVDITRKFYFAYHKKRLLSPITIAFKDFLTNNI